jgi:RND family efflux transporter MFP subunit
VSQKQNSLSEALENYSKYTIKAPFAGKIVDINVLPGDSVTGSTVLATLQTDQKVVELSLNEVDASQVQVDQKAVITFDAIDELSLTGKVIEVGSVGAVNSGVVSYSVKVFIDTIDEQIKQGMSASVSIIIVAKQNILTVPIAAVKTANSESYVEVLIGDQLEKRTVTTGISDDTTIEIISGLAVGEKVITSTTQNTTDTSGSKSTNTEQGPAGAMGQIRMLN